MSFTAKAPNPEKGKRYLASLDQALCNGSWSELPELARKTDKHAPERKCFTLAARTEAKIASASHRPTSASSSDTTSIHSLGEAIPALQEAVTANGSGREDSFCASVCLAEIHSLQGDPEATLKALPKENAPRGSSRTHAAPLGWLEVCSAKAFYLRGAALEINGQDQEAQAVYRAAATQTPGSRTSELRIWTERLLARGCMHSSKGARQPSLVTQNEALVLFRAWASFWERAPPPASGSGTSPARVDVPRRQVWRAYYDLLSSVLQHGILYNPLRDSSSGILVASWSVLSRTQHVEAKTRQRAELKRVEATYESLLLNETQFPKASQTNTEIEEWVEQAVGNWQVLCGADWTDEELGEGGKEAVGRGMLDVLYRAATKTFHSTSILRQLFTVHAAIGEFDLAMHAFNSYVEIVGKGKARAKKTGKHEIGFDTDDIAILTAAEAVRVLCKYGDREQGEKAVAVSKTIQDWLDQRRPTSDDELETSEDNKTGQPEILNHPTRLELQPRTLAAANRAIGIALAHWARLTYETDSRSGLHTGALKSLRKALSYDEGDLETSFALARVLAESQDIPAAIGIIKRSIAFSKAAGAVDGVDDGADSERRKQLLPMWHLLALCLTARDEYDPAMQMCDAAFDQYGDASVLFGQAGARPMPEGQNRALGSIVDQLDLYDKESILQVKMSQLTFVELTEGAENAVEYGDELLSMYARLFGDSEQLKAAPKLPPTSASAAPPTRAGGTLRSIAGSIRPRSGRNSVEKEAFRQTSVASSVPPRTSAGSGGRVTATNGANGSPIAITVTNEDGVSAEKTQHSHQHHQHHLHLPFKVRGHHGDVRETSSLRNSRSIDGLNEKSALGGEGAPPPVPPKDSDVIDHADSAANLSIVQPAVNHSMSPNTPTSPQQPLKEMQHSVPHDVWPQPAAHDSQPPEHDVRLPAPHPASNAMPSPHLGSLQERQHKIGVLVKLWLFIAGLYIRAELHDDANGAIQEAFAFVETLEADKGAQHANARKLFEKGWGGGKSVDELWGDVWSAKGNLASARELPFEAMSHYEQALSHFPDHPEGIIGISDLLLDIYEEKLPAEEPKPLLEPPPTSSDFSINYPVTLAGPGSRPTTAKSPQANAGRTVPTAAARHKDPTPAELNRLAARDRAYMLLANLTKLGNGWDNAEAWYTLARAHELSQQVGKAKQALWWVMELENSKPMRPWSEVAPGGYVL
ncbi:hypothetical protein LTR36_005850 [Oleoguttula mirabilis]|uniref:Filamentation protein n=1 Tax=Oleoguttula mirabilis TaxID=1507867 RepID=A0AAV9JD42_9PEZI|nr:hypothetical protein LTR36_005850 [Oleoguttula mirabilis]